MKKLMAVIFTSLLLLSFTTISFAQCDEEKHKELCIEQLADGFTFIKSYVLEPNKANENGEIEYSFVFSKGTVYMLTFVDSDGKPQDVEITLYDPERNKLASNYNEETDSYIPLGYQCSTTGVHYMTFKFKDKEQDCGVSVLGFKR